MAMAMKYEAFSLELGFQLRTLGTPNSELKFRTPRTIVNFVNQLNSKQKTKSG